MVDRCRQLLVKQLTQTLSREIISTQQQRLATLANKASEYVYHHAGTPNRSDMAGVDVPTHAKGRRLRCEPDHDARVRKGVDCQSHRSSEPVHEWPLSSTADATGAYSQGGHDHDPSAGYQRWRIRHCRGRFGWFSAGAG